MKERAQSVFGDFQTPEGLAREAAGLAIRARAGVRAVVEPTCGTGNFLAAAIEILGPEAQYYGFDINPDHVERTISRTQSAAGIRAHIERRDFYTMDWKAFLRELPERILVIGNPPWVTNASLGREGGENLPRKSNFQRRRGLAARTGHANFDISEWMLIQLLAALRGKDATLAMLCKTSTARKVLRHAWKQGSDLYPSTLHLIDAGRHFGASVDACLLLVHTGSARPEARATVHKDLTFNLPVQTFGIENGELVSDLESFEALRDLDGIERRRWRSGVKHDAARVMELEKAPGGYRNGLGEVWPLEPEPVYPLLKSSDLANGRLVPRKFVILTQTRIAEETAEIESRYPLLWRYLLSHGDLLDGRGSSVYAARPRFSIFGVGDYTFAPWKVAISGLYKALRFQVVGEYGNRPVVVDDTCNFLACRSREEAEFFAALLNSEMANRFLQSLVFFDSKRAITIEALRRIDLLNLAERLGERERAAEFLAGAPFEEGAQRVLVFDPPARYRSASRGKPRGER